jgi:hypothetical protein
MLTDRNYWATYRDSIVDWYGRLPPPAQLGMERVYEFTRYIQEAAEREQVMRIVEVPYPTSYRSEDGGTWLDSVRARFEQEGFLAIFPGGGGTRPVRGERTRLPARLAYYEGDCITEAEVEDVADLEKSLTFGKGGEEDGYVSNTPMKLRGSTGDEKDQAPGRPPTREISISLSLDTDIWFPRVIGLDVGDHGGRSRDRRHPARGRDGLMDNSALAARHTPRLNRFIETLRSAILELGGKWKLDRSGAQPHCLPVLHDGGILLDHPAADA